MKRLIIVLSLVLIIVSAGYGGAGKSGAAFLKIGAGARPSSLGGAYTGIAEDMYSMYYNPAGLNYIRQGEAGIHHNSWIDDITHNFVGAAFRISDKSVVGCNITYLSIGSIPVTREDIFGAYDAGSNGTYTADDMSIGVSYSYNLDGDMNLGMTLKYISQSLAGYKANAYAVDIGFISYYLNEDVKIGASILNLGSGIKFIKETDDLPLMARIGTSISFGEWLFSVDFVKPKDNDLSLRSGLEYKYKGKYFIRAGYRTEDDLSKGITSGLGVKLLNTPNAKQLSLDYAFVPKDNFGDVHILSLLYKF